MKTKELQGLQEMLINLIKERGLNLVGKYNCNTEFMYSIGDSFKETYGETRINEFSGKPYTPSFINGLCIFLKETYHSNAATRNHSFYLEIIKWENNSGKTIEKVKISDTFSNKKQTKLANEIIDNFIELTKVSA